MDGAIEDAHCPYATGLEVNQRLKKRLALCLSEQVVRLSSGISLEVIIPDMTVEFNLKTLWQSFHVTKHVVIVLWLELACGGLCYGSAKKWTSSFYMF